MNPTTGAALLVSLVLAAGACTDEATPPADATSSTSAAEPSESPTSPAPSPSSGVPQTYLTLTTPAIKVPVPVGFDDLFLLDVREILEDGLDGAPPAVVASSQDLIDQIDAGVIVGWFVDVVSDNRPATVTVISAERGDKSLPTAADRRVADLMTKAQGWTVAERDEVELPYGPAIRVVARSIPAPVEPELTSVEYVLLVDGITLSIRAQGRSDAPDVVSKMDLLAEGLVAP